MAEASFGMESGEPIGVGGPAPPLPPTGNPAAVPAKTPSVSVKDDSYAGDYAAYAQRRMTVAAADRSVALAITRNPDEYARYSRLSRQMGGWDPELILDNADAKAEVDRREKLSRIDINSLIDTSPETVAWLANPQRAAVAHDDVNSLVAFERTLTGTLGDVGVVAAKGVMGLPQAAVGVADLMPTIGFKDNWMPTVRFGATGKLLGSVGLDFNKAQKIAESFYSPAQQAASKKVQQADGFFETLGAAIANPSVIATTVGESLPQMLGGAAVARGLLGAGARALAPGLAGPALPGLLARTVGAKAAPLVAGAAGEGILGAGAAAEQIREKSADGYLSVGQVAASIASGVGTAGLSLLGGKLAQRLGIGDIDTALAGGTLTQETVKKGLLRRLAEAGITEGVFEEMPQSAQEQIWQNIATGRPALEGVGNAMAMGLLAGTTTGGSFQGVQYIAGRRLESAASSQERAQLIEDLNRIASASATVSRDADSVEQFIAGIAEDGPVQNLYIDGQTLMQSGMAEQLAAVSPSIAAQITEAAATGGEVRIPIAEYTARIAGTEFAQSLIDDIRIEGEQFTRRQAQEYMQSGAAQELEQLVQSVLTEQQGDTEFKASQERVKTRVLDELNKVNRFTAQKNEVDAMLIAARSAVRAAQLGMTPEQFFEKQMLRVEAQNVAAADALSQARAQTETPEFKNWFGGSKVVDADGKPLVVYHGGAKGITAFDPARIGENFGYDKEGFFFTTEKSNIPGGAANYAGKEGEVYPVYLSIKNPYTLEQYAADVGDTLDRLMYYGGDAQSPIAVFDDNREEIIAKAKAGGHDGIAFNYNYDEAFSEGLFVAFSPTQIKSAIGNRGTFDPTDANILNQTLPSRWPTSKGVVPSVNDPMLADLETLKLDPKQYEKAVEAVASEPGMRVSARKTDTRAEAVITKLVDNLLWLHDQIPAEIRERSKLWYDGARQIADNWAAKYNVSTSQAAGILAVLSPQKDWFMNVTMGERVLDILSTKMDHKFDAKMRASAFQFLLKDVTKPAEKQGNTMAFEAVKDKTLREVVNGGDMLQIGIWLRSYDEAHHDARHTVIHPEGDFGDLVLKDSGEPASRAWGGFDALGKAATIYLDGRPETINEMLGGEHKVRNFYNNIFNPSDARFATIDTHAVAAALLRPLAGADKPVADNFGKTGGTNVTGVSGTYPIYFEAYKRAAEARGILPREMQSITWEAVRGLFPDTFKTKENKAALAELWSQADKGKLTTSQAREKVTEMAGGIRHPDWWNGAEPAPLVTRDKSYEQTRELEPGRKIVFEVAPTPDNAQLTKRWTALPVETQNQISADMAWSVSRAVFAAYANVANVGRTTDVLDNVKGELHLARGGYMGFANASMSLRMGKYASFPQVKAIASMLGHVLRQREVPITSPDSFKGATKKETVILVGVATKDADSVYTDLYNAPNLRKEDGSPMVEGHTTEGGAMVIIVPEGRGESIAAAIEAHVGGKYDVGTGVIYDEWLGKEAGDYGLSGTDKSGGRGTESSLRAHADRIRTETDAEFERRIEEAERAVGVFYQGAGERQGAVTGPVVGVHYSKGERNILASSFSRTGMSGAEWERLQTAKDDRIKQRINFYVNTGKGVTPESDVGNFAHVATLDNLYDTDADVLKLHRNSRGDMNAFESAVLDAGFSGYLTRGFGDTGAVVMLGSRSVPVEYVGGKVEADQRAEVPPGAETPAAKAAASAILGNRSLPMGQMKPDSWQRILTAVAPDIASQIDFSQLDPNKDYYRDQIAGLLWQPGAKTVRGSFNPATSTITLLKAADLSTFLHEAGHYFFEGDIALAGELSAKDPATLTDGEKQIIADVSALLTWHGIQGDINAQLVQWHSMDFEERRAHHERTAEAFEAYLFEGKAPSIELQPYFQKFRAWLISVYRSLKDFITKNPEAGKLDDTVRQVFDRMLATTEQIKLAEQGQSMLPLFATAEQAGMMTTTEFAAYQALGIEATASAIQTLQAKTLRDLAYTRNARSREISRLQKEAKARRDEVEMEVRREVMSQPVYRAWQFLTGKAGEKTEPQTEYEKDVADWQQKRAEAMDAARKAERDRILAEHTDVKGLAKGQLLARFKKDTDLVVARAALDWDRANPKPTAPEKDSAVFDLGEQVYGRLNTSALDDMGIPEEITAHIKKLRMAAPDGLGPDVVAEMFGFSSGDELVRTLAAAQKPKDEIDNLTDKQMLERYGELATPEAIELEADKAIRNDTRARFVTTEANALAKATGQRKILASAARDYAKALIARLKIRDIRPGQYAQAEVRAAKAAEAARRSGDIATAAAEKRNQVIQNYAAIAAYAALVEIEKGVRYLRKFDKVSKTLDPDYAGQIDALLERFDLRNRSLAAIDRSIDLAGWIESQREQGIEPDIPEQLKNEAFRKSYKELTVEEFRGVVDTVKQIEHLGRLKNKLLTAKDKREFEAAKQEIATSIEANAGNRTADSRTPTTNLGRKVQSLKRFRASHYKVAMLARVLDGGKDGGPVWEYFVRSANERGDMETRMRSEATLKLSEILAPVFKLGKMGGAGLFFPSIKRSLNREARIALALNVGNAGNLQRLLGGEGWTAAQIQPVLESLTAQEWAAVQAIWDHFESYRPEIGAKERRVYGKEPSWIDATPLSVTTSDGQQINLRGGYYPIKYDPAASQRSEEHADAEDAKRQLQGAYTTATTRRSFTKTRAEEVSGRPLLYTLSGLYSGVNDVIHDLAWHEWLIDVNRLLKSKTIDTAIRGSYGPEVKTQFKSWVADIAEGDKSAQNAGEVALSRLRQGISAAGLGFNVVSAAMQITGFNQSIVRVGPGWIGRGIAKYMAAPIEAAREVVGKSSFMAERARTQFRELNELRNMVQDESAAMRSIKAGTYFLMMRMQKMVDVPTWWGAYEKAMSDPANFKVEADGVIDDSRAVALADQAVIDSQGSGMTKDLSAIERGGPALKLFTVYYSFMNTAFNLGVGQTMTARSKAKWAADMLMLYTVPVVLGVVLKQAMVPGGDDEWEPEKLARKLAAEQLSYLMGTMIVVREFSDAAKIVTGAEGVGRDYSGPAGLRAISDTFGFVKQARQGEFDDAFRKSLINLLGDFTGLPSAQINRTITGTTALIEGKTENPAAVIFGYQKPK